MPSRGEERFLTSLEIKEKLSPRNARGRKILLRQGLLSKLQGMGYLTHSKGNFSFPRQGKAYSIKTDAPMGCF